MHLKRRLWEYFCVQMTFFPSILEKICSIQKEHPNLLNCFLDCEPLFFRIQKALEKASAYLDRSNKSLCCFDFFQIVSKKVCISPEICTYFDSVCMFSILAKNIHLWDQLFQCRKFVAFWQKLVLVFEGNCEIFYIKRKSQTLFLFRGIGFFYLQRSLTHLNWTKKVKESKWLKLSYRRQ